jgi:hypothetical protein
MAIKKQEFYEGAALHALVCSGALAGIRYRTPFFEVEGRLWIYLKYSTRVRGPWGFTFTGGEQALLADSSSGRNMIIGLVCGADGVAAINGDEFKSIVAPRTSAIRVACSRLHGEHYEVKGPDGALPRKVPPSKWQRILER